MKYIALFIFLNVLLSTCSDVTEKDTIKKEHKLENQLLELSQNIESVQLNILHHRCYGFDSSVLDSLEAISTQLKIKLDSIQKTSGITISSAQKNCIKRFGLSPNLITNEKKKFLSVFYAYEICGAKYISCGFTIDSTQTQRNNRIKAIQIADYNLRQYRSKKIDSSLNIAFPKIKEEDKKILYMATKNYLQTSEMKVLFQDSACLISTNDSILNDLYLQTNYASYKKVD